MLSIYRELRFGFFAALFCCAVVVSASAQQTGTQSPATGGAANPIGTSQMGIREYRLGPGDLLDLRVFNEPQFDSTLEVNSDGTIFIPFVDFAIQAQCRKVDEVRKDVAAQLSKLLRQPRVSLLVKEKRSRTPAVVYGAVRMPQQIQMYRRAHLLELIGYAQGFTEQASGTISVFHTEPLLCPEPGDVVPVEQNTDEVTLLPFEVYSVTDLRAGKKGANPLIRPGDLVRVDEANPVYITGAVLQPQGVYLRPQTTLTTVIAQVGGLRREAKDSIRIYRRLPDSPTGFETIAVNYADIRKRKTEDIILKPYDVIEVGEAGAFSSKLIGQTLLNFATQGASQVVLGGAGRIANTILY